ncbi:MAG: hypothetical protein PHE49_07325 [bacterium]|nr:hypothetical protein [bacterium]
MKRFGILFVVVIVAISGCKKNNTTQPEKERNVQTLISESYSLSVLNSTSYDSWKNWTLSQLKQADTLIINIYPLEWGNLDSLYVQLTDSTYTDIPGGCAYPSGDAGGWFDYSSVIYVGDKLPYMLQVQNLGDMLVINVTIKRIWWE